MNLKVRNARVSETNAAQHMNINTIAGNGASKMLTRHGVVSARDAQEHGVGHTINALGFEVLSAFKSNSRVGRAMPKFMNGCAMGVATMGGRQDWQGD